MFITGLQPIWKISSILILLSGLLYLSNQEKKQQSLRFKFAEVKSHLRLWKCKKLAQTCGFAVADHILLFCGICGYGIEFKFAMPSTAEKPLKCSARWQRSIVLDEQFL